MVGQDDMRPRGRFVELVGQYGDHRDVTECFGERRESGREGHRVRVMHDEHADLASPRALHQRLDRHSGPSPWRGVGLGEVHRPADVARQRVQQVNRLRERVRVRPCSRAPRTDTQARSRL